ncbi:hypothetical protein FZEAL_3915 [Fusarium zealandicum]|uniref:Uncharacterized protein n=1 Tax=Fusarium zealandicum TaxID=1053134 RepID=A0A8H4UNL8_9HYPO|nr:hypothetical protein FZEAL_3915 [Fusarium zealandicum]
MQPNNNLQSVSKSTVHPLKRHRSDSNGNHNEVKHRHVEMDELLPAPGPLAHCETSQLSAYAFSTLQSSNHPTVGSLNSSWDPSQRVPQDTNHDSFDDPELERYLENLGDPMRAETPNISTCSKDSTPAFALDQSEDEYDPELQHSSPRPTTGAAEISANDPPLVEDTDWSIVRECARQRPTQVSGLCPDDSDSLVTKGLPPTQGASIHSKSQSSVTVKSTSSAPFVRQVSSKPYKTFFELDEMLDAKTQMFMNQPNAIFELFGRVLHSTRENFRKLQYFQFRSLLKDHPPYLNGTLLGWEVGSPSDCAAQEFLKSRSSQAKCFCRCKLRRDPRAGAGWFILVLEIRPATWKEVQKAMDVLGRQDLDEPGSSSRG